MQKTKIVFLIALLAIVPTIALAQETTPGDTVDLPFDFTAAEAAVIVIGSLGGLTSAYLGMKKAKREATPEKPFVFKTDEFLDRLVLAIIPAVGFAVAASADIIVLNFFSIYYIFVASLGTSELVLEFTALRKK